MKTKSQTLIFDSFGSCEIQCSETLDDKGTPKLPTVNIVAYTGIPLKQPGYRYPVIVDLKGIHLDPTRTPFLVNHDDDQIAGHSTDITNDGKVLTASGVLSGPSKVTQSIIEMAKNAYPWQASIGASVGQLELVSPEDTVDVNGQTFSGPVYVARQSVLREISLTPVGVDQATDAEITAKDATRLKGKLSMSFQEWLTYAGVNPETLTPDQLAILEKAYRAVQEDEEEEDTADPGEGQNPEDMSSSESTTDDEPKAAAAAKAILDIRARAVKETKRIAAITKVAGKHPEICAKAISEGWSPEKAELTVLRALRPAAPAVHSGFDRNAITSDMLVASLVNQSNQLKTEQKKAALEDFDQRTVEAALSKPVRDITRQGFSGLFHTVCAAAGKHVAPGKMTQELWRWNRSRSGNQGVGLLRNVVKHHAQQLCK